MTLRTELGDRSYDITVERGALACAGEKMKLSRRALIVTDSGVPKKYAEAVAVQCAAPTVVTVPAGETSKNLTVFGSLLSRMLAEKFTRTDCVVAVGGGVVGDLSGFAAACYMRGIDFYNLPTTLLAQVDSSVGGKTAVDLDGVKNCVGSFWQPRAVIIDPDVLATLPKRQIANGMAEVVKMALTSDAELFGMLETESADVETVILRSLQIKKSVVESDERESGLRRVLNFGHTLGHGIESAAGLHDLLHGECVALGMLPLCAPEVRARLVPLLKQLGLPTVLPVSPETVLGAVCHDKKCDGGTVSYVYVPRVGEYEFRRSDIGAFCDAVRPSLEAMRKGETE